jgi:hypothetical protein
LPLKLFVLLPQGRQWADESSDTRWSRQPIGF